MSFSAHDHRKESDGSLSDKIKVPLKLSERHDSIRKNETTASMHQHRKSDAEKTLCQEPSEKNTQAASGDPSVRVSTEFAGVTIIFRSAVPQKTSEALGKSGVQVGRRRSEFQQSSLPTQYRMDHSDRTDPSGNQSNTGHPS